jgi:16S rRNA processing protein RimM
MFLVIGKLRRPHGVRGEILMEVLTDFPERIKPGSAVFVGEQHTPRLILSRRSHQQGMLLTFEGLQTPEAVGVLRNEYVYVSAADRPALPAGEYYHHQLVGIQVFTLEGELLGELSEIMVSAAHDIYVIRMPIGRQILIPAVESYIKEIDLENQRMVVSPIPGLLEE